jgi:hypothetical protein
MTRSPLVTAALLAALASVALADEPGQTAALTPSVRVGETVFYRSHEDAFPRAKKEGKLVLFYRMLGELDGET